MGGDERGPGVERGSVRSTIERRLSSSRRPTTRRSTATADDRQRGEDPARRCPSGWVPPRGPPPRQPPPTTREAPGGACSPRAPGVRGPRRARRAAEPAVSTGAAAAAAAAVASSVFVELARSGGAGFGALLALALFAFAARPPSSEAPERPPAWLSAGSRRRSVPAEAPARASRSPARGHLGVRQRAARPTAKRWAPEPEGARPAEKAEPAVRPDRGRSGSLGGRVWVLRQRVRAHREERRREKESISCFA